MMTFPRPGSPLPDSTLNRWLLYPGLGLLLLAGLLWLGAGYQAAFMALNRLGQWLPDAFWTHLTLLGDSRIAVALALPFALRSPALAWRVILALIIGGLGVHLMKSGFAMPRPPAVLDTETFRLLGPALKKGAFPSGHSLTAFAACGLAIAFLPRPFWRWLALALAAWVAASRFMVGVHWPVDVLAGSGLGLLSAWAAMKLAPLWPWGESCRAHAAWTILLVFTTLSLPGYDGHFPQNKPAGTILAVVIALLSIWSWLDGKNNRHETTE